MLLFFYDREETQETVGVVVTVLGEYEVGHSWAKGWFVEYETAMLVRLGDDPMPRIFVEGMAVEMHDGESAWVLRIKPKNVGDDAEYENVITGERNTFALKNEWRNLERAPAFPDHFILQQDGGTRGEF